MRAYLLTFVLVTFFIQISFGQNNPFLDLQEVDLLESDCELKNWYEDFKNYRKKNKNYEDHIKILTQKINLIDSNNCIRNEQLDTLEGRLYFHLGVAYRITGLVEKSHVYYNKAFDVFKLYSNNKSLASTCRKLGSIWRLKKDFNKANDYFKNSAKICVKNKFDKQLHKTYNETIINYYRWDRPKDTIAVDDIYLKAKAIPNIDKEDRLALEANRALFFLAIENYENALNIYFSSEVEYRKLLEDKELNKSEKKIKELQTNLAKTLLNIAKIKTNLNQFNEADMQFIKIEELIEQDKVYKNDKHFYQDYLIAKAAYYEKQDQLEKALNEYQKVLQLTSINFTYQTIYQNPSPNQIIGNPYLLTTLADKAEIFKKMHTQTNNKTNLTHALECYGLSYSAADQMRKEYSFEEANTYMSAYTYSYYEKAIELCLQLSKAYPTQKEKYQQKAFEIAQRSSMKTLFWTINSKVATKFLPEEEVKSIEELRKKLNEAKENVRKPNNSKTQGISLFEVQQNYDQALKILEEKYPKYAKLKFENQLVSVDTLQQNRLNENEALLNYFVVDSSITCFVVTQTSFQLVEINEVDSVLNNIKLLRESIQKKNTSDDMAVKLYQQLLPKVLVDLPKNINTLIINADAALASLPFEALKEQANNSNYLLHKYTVSYTLHPYFLKKQAPQSFFNLLPSSWNPFRATKKFMGFAANYANNDNLESLPFAKQEIEKVNRIMGGTIYPQTTKQLAITQMENADIIHFATHANGDSLQTENSKIFLTPYEDDPTQNELCFDEILSLNCTADMVVLSACQTGLGVYNRGEGISSLARAFRTTGSKSVLMSLWKVDDLSTSAIMENFYRYLQKGQPKNEALRKAKIDFLASDKIENHQKDPFYWAAFLLQGESDALY